MKIRPSILLFVAVVLALIVWMLWYGKKETTKTPLMASTQTNAALFASIQPSMPTNAPIQGNTSAPPSVAGINSILVQPKSKWEQMQSILATDNDQPIVFYGKIEDQFNNAIANAVVTFGVRIYNGYESTVKSGQMTSDENGSFTISGYKGESLGLGVKKKGYILVSMNGSSIYSKLYPENQRAHPDQNNPTLIKMYKLQGAQQLASFNIKTYIPIDGTPVQFSLKTGQQVQSGGDLIISIQSSPKPSVQDGYDWQASIQMANGGIIQDIGSSGSGLEKMFQAPDSGYAPEFDLSFQKGTQQWTSRFIDGFYFTTQNGQAYGKMAISIITDRVKNGAIPISLNGYLNPSGSRNLELDSQ